MRQQILLMVLLMCGFFLKAQQTMLFSQHAFNRTFINPANAGTEEAIRGTLLYRNQWVGLPGSPEYQTLTVDAPLYGINGGAGLQLYNDQIGVQQTIGVSGIFAIHRKLGDGQLSIGARAGYMQVSFDGSRLTTPGGEYTDNTVVNHNDGVIPNVNVNGGAPDAGLGLQYVMNRWFIGLSADHLLGNPVSMSGSGQSTSFTLRRHVNFHTGITLPINDQWNISPTALLRSDFVKNQVDISVVANYNSFLLMGAGFRGYDGRSQDALIAILGVQLSTQWIVGYSYDYTISPLNSVNQGTHELSVQYKVPVLRPRVGKVINNPRFLSY